MIAMLGRLRPMNAHVLATVALAFLPTSRAIAQDAFRPANIQEQMFYQRAYEIAIWATPMLNSLQLRAELLKHGAKEGDLAYLGSRPTGRIELPTFNNTTPYVFGGGSLKGGPVVIEVPDQAIGQNAPS